DHNELSGDIPSAMYYMNQLATCIIGPQDTTDGGFTCPYPINPVCNFGRTDVCTLLVSTEIQALVDLQTSLQPQNWTGVPSCSWSGITCDDFSHRVTVINVEGKATQVGTIPTSIGQFPYLLSLNLGSNNINGTIPSEIGDLTRIQYISLSANSMTGTIPSTIGQWTSAAYVSFSTNQLTGSIPTEIGNLNKMTFLALDTNQLSGSIPDTIGSTKLDHLYLQGNQLTGSIPDSLGNLTSMVQLNLGHNH